MADVESPPQPEAAATDDLIEPEPPAEAEGGTPDVESEEAAPPDVEQGAGAVVDDAIPVTTFPVLVTGATGFAASEIIHQLLERGYRVRGTVRDLNKDAAYRHLIGMAENIGRPSAIDLVEANLNDEESWVAAVDGCEIVIHVASPFSVNVSDPQADLVDPAVNGTLGVLRACKKANTREGPGDPDDKPLPRVKRVVMTSSAAAIADAPEDRVYTRDDWNAESSLTLNAYMYSKTMAEHAAWDFMEKEVLELEHKFDLVTILPTGIIGPVTHPRHLNNPTMETFGRYFGGEFPGIIRFSMGIVDVRDVALCHIRAMECESAKGRYIVSSGCYWMRDYIEMIKANEAFADYAPRLPTMGLDGGFGKRLTWVVSWFQKAGEGQFLRCYLDRKAEYDTSPCQTELGMPPFMDPRETVWAAVQALIDGDVIKRAKGCGK